MFTREEALEASTEYFHGDFLAAEAFVDKYAISKDNVWYEKTPDDMHRRLAKEFARIESNYPNPLSEEEIYNYLKDFSLIVPQGSPMSGIGHPYTTQSVSNCCVIDGPEDNISSIVDRGKDLANLFKNRFGVGLDLSKLRPQGTVVSNAAKNSTGAWSFSELYSTINNIIGQAGRRAATMLTLSIRHPDAIHFAQMKLDESKVTGANVSLRITDEFMKAVEEDGMFTQAWPIDSDNPVIKQEIRARDLWDIVVNCAHKVGDPGLLMWDNIVKNSPADFYGFATLATNPCQPGWATVLTPEGIRTISQIEIGSTIWSGKQWTKVTNKVHTGKKLVYDFITRAGKFIGTENHNIISEGQRIKAVNAETIDVCLGPNVEREKLDPIDIMDGLLLGDGMIQSSSNQLTLLLIGEKDHCYHNSEIAELLGEHRPGINKFAWTVKEHTFIPSEKTFNRRVPNEFLTASIKKKCGLLRGLYSANGSVVDNRITLKSTSLSLIETVQVLLSSLGISSYYTVNKETDVTFANGTYRCKESYDLNIGVRESRAKFNRLIGFIHPYKNEKVIQSLESGSKSKYKTSYEVIEKKSLGLADVWDITVDAEEHTYWTGGLLVSNCSEIPMCTDTCRLISINLLGHVENPFTKRGAFDAEKFRRTVEIGMRLSDDLVDLELEQLEKIKAKALKDEDSSFVQQLQELITNAVQLRRTGLGLHALYDTLAACGVQYDSPEGVSLTEEIYRLMGVTAYATSAQLAKERGAFPVFTPGQDADCLFIQRLQDTGSWPFKTSVSETPRRNVMSLTGAPTGTVSLLSAARLLKVGLGGTSSGVEPAIDLEFTRFKKLNHNSQETPDRVDLVGVKWKKFECKHPAYQYWLNLNPNDRVPESVFKTIANVDPLVKVDLVAAAQKYVDHGISCTHNLPKGATKAQVEEIYMKAWKAGMKGITVYVDGSRETQVLETKGIKEHHAPKRPTDLPCDIHRRKIDGEYWTVLVGLYEGKPYEVFCGKSEDISIGASIKNGVLKKSKSNGQSQYDLHFSVRNKEQVIHDIVAVFDNKLYADQSRLVSMSLRHGVPLEFIAEQLDKSISKANDSEDEFKMDKFSQVVARVIKSYIPDQTKSHNKCSQCGNTSMIFQEGCLRCLSCNTSPRCS